MQEEKRRGQLGRERDTETQRQRGREGETRRKRHTHKDRDRDIHKDRDIDRSEIQTAIFVNGKIFYPRTTRERGKLD